MNILLQQNRYPAVDSVELHHLIEDESEERSDERSNASDLPQESKQLQDALTTWQDVNGVVRQVGRFLIHREMAALKTIAAEASHREESTATSTASDKASTISPEARHLQNYPNKRRRISDSNSRSEVQPSPVSDRMEGILNHKMNRMRRLNAILKSLSESHIELEKEISDMLGEATDAN